MQDPLIQIKQEEEKALAHVAKAREKSEEHMRLLSDKLDEEYRQKKEQLIAKGDHEIEAEKKRLDAWFAEEMAKLEKKKLELKNIGGKKQKAVDFIVEKFLTHVGA